MFETIHILKEELTTLAREQELQIENVKKVSVRSAGYFRLKGNSSSLQFCKQRSFSDSDINSCEEFLSNKRPFSVSVSQDSRLGSLASSSESHYGSESAMELYNRAEHIHAGLGHDLLSTIEMVEEEVDVSLASDSLDPLNSSLGIGGRDQSKRSSDKSRLMALILEFLKLKSFFLSGEVRNRGEHLQTMCRHQGH